MHSCVLHARQPKEITSKNIKSREKFTTFILYPLIIILNNTVKLPSLKVLDHIYLSLCTLD